MSSILSPENVRNLWVVRMLDGLAPVVSKETPPKLGTFLLFEQKGGCQRSDVVSRVERWECVTVPYSVGKRSMMYLRNIRYKSGMGSDVLFCFCASCGWEWTTTTAGVLERRMLGCPQCKAKPSGCKCPVFHAFGRCTACTDEALDDCPFPAREPGSSVDVASHVPAA